MPTGGCLCGEIRYVVRGEIGPVDHCHCSMCRRSHGAPFSTFGRIRRADLELTAGADRLTEYASSAPVVRSFCARCGSRLFFRHDALPEHTFVAVSTLDDPSTIEPEAHIFVGSRASWFRITDDLPRHEAYPASAGSAEGEAGTVDGGD